MTDEEIMAHWASTPNTHDMRVDLQVFAGAIIAQARAELIAGIQDRVRRAPRVRPGVYSLKDQIAAFHDGFEAGRMSALNSFPKP